MKIQKEEKLLVPLPDQTAFYISEQIITTCLLQENDSKNNKVLMKTGTCHGFLCCTPVFLQYGVSHGTSFQSLKTSKTITHKNYNSNLQALTKVLYFVDLSCEGVPHSSSCKHMASWCVQSIIISLVCKGTSLAGRPLQISNTSQKVSVLKKISMFSTK